MKQKFLTKVISVLLTVVMLAGAVPATVITAFADGDTTQVESTQTTSKEEPSLADIITKEMAERTPVTKDRSAIPASSQAAVYIDGELFDHGGFSPMWNVAMEHAAFVNPGKNESNNGRSQTVEYVLNKDFRYDSSWFSEKTMTVSNRIFTIDLNGHVLYRYDEGGSVIKVTKQSQLTIMDSNPTEWHGGYLRDNMRWQFSNGSTSKKLQGGIITGGYHSTGDGGGIFIEEESSVRMTGGTVAGNKADIGSGIFVGNTCTLDMSEGTSQICYNYSAGTSTDGGAVFLRPNATMVGGYVHNNFADDYGGGVRAKGGNILIKDVVIYANKSDEYGGGLFVERSKTNQIVTVVNCKIIKNFANKDGGGVYLWDLYLTQMIDCWIEGNETNAKGGGIFVSNSTGTDLSISGKMIVRKNYEKKVEGKQTIDVDSNLYLGGNDDLIVESLAIDSEIGIKTRSSASDWSGIDHTLLVKETGTSHLFFKADESGYCVRYQNDPAKKHYRHLYLDKGTRTEDAIKTLADYSTKELDTPYTIGSGEYAGETLPLYKGYFEYNLMTTDDFLSASPFYYSDGYFFEDPEVYNTHLATMSINMAVAAFGRSTNDVGENTYANHFANVKQMFSDIGCDDEDFFANEDYQNKPTYNDDGSLASIGVAISQKEISLNGETYTLVPVAIRGGGYGVEWASNVTIGLTGQAAGFSDAALKVYKHVQSYIENYGLSEQVANGKIKFWVVGYSRAGATANLASKRLIDAYAKGGNQIFGYTFEAPMGGIESDKKIKDYTGNGTYPTIHNTINELDFVTLVAPVEMGFIRYGVDHLVGSTEGEKGYDLKKTDSTYYKQRMKMVAQLNAINPYYKFDDRWELADINVILGNIPIIGTDLIDKGVQPWDFPNAECEVMYTFLRWFFYHVQVDGLDLPLTKVTDPDDRDKYIMVPDISKAREYYSDYRPLKTDKPIAGYYGDSSMSVGEALASIMSLVMYSLTEEQMAAMVEVVMNNGSFLKSYLKDFKFWDSQYLEYGVIMAVITPAFLKLEEIFYLYDEALNEWDEHSNERKAETIDWLISLLTENAGGSMWSVLTPEQRKVLEEALPVTVWFLLNYASMDYNVDSKNIFNDDGMWGLGTFINNMETIISNHYQEVSVAWVRSYDSFYEKDVQAYKIDAAAIDNAAPTGNYTASNGLLTLSAKEGSSIFYSVDDGSTWTLYTRPVELGYHPEEIQTFSIYHGAKSEVSKIAVDVSAGSLFGSGNIWILIIGSLFVVGFCVAGIEVTRRKKKKAEQN